MYRHLLALPLMCATSVWARYEDALPHDEEGVSASRFTDEFQVGICVMLALAVAVWGTWDRKPVYKWGTRAAFVLAALALAFKPVLVYAVIVFGPVLALVGVPLYALLRGKRR